jgi:adenosine kinase
MTALICGSIAYDTIMVYRDRFGNHILPDKVHILNVCFVVPELRREFGGCGGNVAYNLQLLGGKGLLLGTVGDDFEPYRRWMDQHGIDRSHVHQISDSYTAQAFITSDLDDNQITAFHPGAMGYSVNFPIPLEAGISLGLVAPDGYDGMMSHAQQFSDAGIPFIFDPGQNIPLFSGEELRRLIRQASYLTVNDYECELIQNRTGLSLDELVQQVQALIVTRGGNGSYIYTGGQRLEIPAAPVSQVVDPTGCGDAYRAGLLYGLMAELDWETTGRIASLTGAIKIEKPGTQNHHFDPAGFRDRFQQAFGYRF